MIFQSLVMNVSDLDRSIEFYRDVFGFAVLNKKDQLAALSAPGSDRPQVIVLRAFGTSGRIRGARHIGIRAFVLEVGSNAELEQIEQRLEGRGSLVRRLTDNANWTAVATNDPDHIAILAGSPLGTGQITDESWAALHESLYGIGE